MKIKFSYLDLSKYRKKYPSDSPRIRPVFKLIDAPKNMAWSYEKYLLSSLDSDFYENRFGDCETLLNEVQRVERGEVKQYIFESGSFTNYIDQTSVIFEHAIFSVCPDWPLWSCPLSHYKIGLQAARDFYAMPESLDTELIAELPESSMAKIVIFPPKLAERMTDE